jgi:hypothetical protein
MLLLCNTAHGLKLMLKIIEDFGEEYEIKINGDKTQLMIVNNRNIFIDHEFTLCGKKLEVVDSIKYLGVIIQSNFKNNIHVDERISKVNKAWHCLRTIGIDHNALSVKTKIRMYKTYLRPILMYGLDVISLNVNTIETIERIENNLIKKILGISRICHHSDLLNAIHINTFTNTLIINKLKLTMRLICNDFTRDILDSRALENTNNTLVNINDLWKDVWYYLEPVIVENFSLIDVHRQCIMIVKNEKMKFKYASKYDDNVNKIKNILSNEKFHIRKELLHSELIPLAVMLNEHIS